MSNQQTKAEIVSHVFKLIQESHLRSSACCEENLVSHQLSFTQLKSLPELTGPVHFNSLLSMDLYS